MRYIEIIILIMIYFTSLTLGLTYMQKDEFINVAFQGNITNLQTGVTTSNINMTSASATPYDSDKPTARGFLNTLSVMFSFATPTSVFPPGLAQVIVIFDWILITIFGIAVYKIANPVSSA